MDRSWIRVTSILCCILSVGLCYQTALAGTTGGISGRITDIHGNAGISGVSIRASSASQDATAVTDATGHFALLSLAPDRYVVTAIKLGFESAALQNVIVFADTTDAISIAMHPLTLIAQVHSGTLEGLVRAGTTSDVYSVDANVANTAQALGGGGGLNNAYSAIATIPGTFVPPGQQGWFQNVYIRGGNYDAVGYEYDGVPVNRSFDNYPGSTLANLGQQELQVYPGGGPASASATGIAGFINQVIRTGTYPGYIHLNLQTGAPAFYHDAGIEAGGASRDHRFRYYVGFNGYNQDYRLVDQFNGGGIAFPGYAQPIMSPALFGLSGGAAPACASGRPPSSLPSGIATPSCYVFAPGYIFNNAAISDREGLLNLHYALPHRHDSAQDDLQLLIDASALNTYVYDSQSDIGPTIIQNAFGGPLSWTDATVFPTGTVFGEPISAIPVTGNSACPAPSRCSTYFYPSSPANRSPNSVLPTDKRGGQENDAAIVKLQYQKNFGSSGYLRLFGYTLYSDWLINDPNSVVGSYGLGLDYELSTHTRGVELQFAKQLSSEHLLQATANYTTATTLRFSNSTSLISPQSRVTNLVDSFGNCYGRQGAIAACNGVANEGTFANPSPFAAAGAALTSGANWIVTGARAGFSESGLLNTVVPKFTSFSIQDEFRPDDRFLFNLGFRFEHFGYALAGTQSPQYDFWFKAAQREFCYDPLTLAPALGLSTAPGAACPINPATGTQEVHPDGLNGHLLINNDYGQNIAAGVFSPRISLTFTPNPDTVFRLAYGRYAQPMPSAFVQYDTKQPNLASFLFRTFWRFGITTPRHDVTPQISDTYDFSYEHRLQGTPVSFKVTPFLRDTSNQKQLFILDPLTGAVSAFNVGREKSYGVELALSAGDFAQQGFAASLAYTYTNSMLRYDDFIGGTRNVVDIVNDQINAFNSFTAAGGGFPCYQNVTTGSGAGETASQCAADPNAIANPYYTIQAQPLFDRKASYYPYDAFPTVPGAATNSYYSPQVFTGVFQYRRAKLAIAPSFEFDAGTHYGAPLNVVGVDPSACGQNSAAANIAAPNPQQPEYTSCGAIPIPDPENGNRFDGFGQYVNPSQLSINAQISYAVSAKMTTTLVLSNIVNRCFGGSVTPWSQAAPPGVHGVCNYNGNSLAPFVSNMYNGFGPNDTAANGGPLNPYIAHAYQATGFSEPFQAFFQVDLKL
jgi:hypothetical protein